MNNRQNTEHDPADGEEEPQGPERYLKPGEELLVYTPDIQIKKFRFDAYLTNSRLFLTDQDEKNPGVTAKEIPIESVADSHLEHSPSQEPILVLSIRTSDDDLRTMKMVFVHNGTERLSQAEEWMHLIRHGVPAAAAGGRTGQGPRSPAVPPISPEARALSETIILARDPVTEGPGPLSVQDHEGAPVPKTPLASIPPTPQHAQEHRQASIPPTQASTTQILFCFHCGHRLPPNANFCPYCGTRIAHARPTSTPPAPMPPAKEPAAHEPPPEKVKEKKGRFFWPFKKK